MKHLPSIQRKFFWDLERQGCGHNTTEHATRHGSGKETQYQMADIGREGPWQVGRFGKKSHLQQLSQNQTQPVAMPQRCAERAALDHNSFMYMTPRKHCATCARAGAHVCSAEMEPEPCYKVEYRYNALIRSQNGH